MKWLKTVEDFIAEKLVLDGGGCVSSRCLAIPL